MKKIIYISSIILLISISVKAQTKEVSANMQTAIKNSGVELFENGAVKIKVDVSRIDAYYKWASTPDTIYAYNQMANWDKESLLAYQEMYNSLDMAEVSSKYKLWMKSVSSNDVQYASTEKSKFKINQRY